MSDQRISENSISDNRRRTICRFAFLLFCALPTMTTVYWIFHPQTPAGWQQAIQANLAIETSVASVECKGPYETILRGVEFSDPEIGTLLNATQVRVIRGKTNQVIVESPVSITSKALVEFVNRIRVSLIRSHSAEQPWQIALGKTTITGDLPGIDYQPSIIARSAVIDIVPYPKGTAATMHIQLENDPTHTPVRFEILRGAGDCSDFQEIRLATSSNYLPTWLIHDLVPDARNLGRDCQFTGELVYHPSDLNGPSAEVEGILSGVDLQSLVGPFGQTLTGKCDVKVNRFKVVDGRVHTMSADASCSRGTVGVSLLKSAVDHLRFDVPAVVSSTEVEFNNLSLRCEIDQGEFTFHSPPNGVIAFTPRDDGLYTALVTAEAAIPAKVDSFASFLVRPEDSTPFEYDQRMVSVLNRFHVPPVRVADQNTGNLH